MAPMSLDKNEAPQRGLWQSPIRKRFLNVFYAISCYFTRVLVHFGSCVLGTVTQKYKNEENVAGLVKLRCILAFLIVG